MDENKLKEILSSEVDSLKESLSHFVKAEDMQKEISDLKKSIDNQNIKGLEEKMSSLEKAAEQQGLILAKIKETGSKERETFKDQLSAKIEEIGNLETNEKGKVSIGTTRKAVTASSITDDTRFQYIPGVGQIQRGMPWLRDLFPVVTLGANTHGSIVWHEQEAITSNAAAVAEGAAPGSQSTISWVEKTLAGKRLKDFIKVSKDQLKDVDYIAGEVRQLVDKNMRLLENTSLYTGTGAGNNVKGIKTYAQTFDATPFAGTIASANLFDLINVVKNKIKTVSLDGFDPNNVCLYPTDAMNLRLEKDDQDRYLFPEWAMNGINNIAGLTPVENSLVTTNTMLVGDFNYGTIYEWDGLIIEMGYESDDFLNGLVTIMAYERINLRVKDTDVDAFYKVTNIASDVAEITEAVA